MTNGNDVTHNTKHTILFNKTKFTPYSVSPAHAPASVQYKKYDVWCWCASQVIGEVQWFFFQKLEVLIVPTEKKQRADEDVPFVKLSNMLSQGWLREAYIKMTASRPRKTHYIQCTTWRDKKQVMFLSNNRIGASRGLTVKRRIHGKRESKQPYRSHKLMPIMLRRWTGWIGMTMTVLTIRQVFGQTATTSDFFAGDWTGLCMRLMLS